MDRQKANIWWGPPRNFVPAIEHRRISWLELFYDLVYVIAISRVTHHFAAHPGLSGLIDYLYLFIMIFWGWINGSLYHDLHGSPGIRTRFMTLWQMVAVAALVVCLSSSPEIVVFRTTVALMVLQLYITYLWWSVGIYDKAHRVYNRPYTICYQLATAMLGVTLFTKLPYEKMIFWVALVLNFLPPFLVIRKLRRNNTDFSLSPNMVERLGLLTIIVFGECVLGVIDGAVPISDLNATLWINFTLGILVIFALWWIYFSIIGDRESCGGFLNANMIELAYIPTLASLGIIGASFPALFLILTESSEEHQFAVKMFFGGGLAVFLLGIILISFLLKYPKEFDSVKKKVRLVTEVIAFLILMVTVLPGITLTVYLVLVFVLLLSLVIYLTRIWFVLQLQMMEQEG